MEIIKKFFEKRNLKKFDEGMSFVFLEHLKNSTDLHFLLAESNYEENEMKRRGMREGIVLLKMIQTNLN